MKCIKFVTVVFSLVSGFACTKNFDKMNTNPVMVTKDLVKPSMLFTAVLKQSIFSSYGNSIFKEYSNYYSNEASGVIFQNQDWTSPFSDYQGNLINISEVVRLTADNPELVNEHAMGRIWKVWLFQQLTDAYGDLPYSEALLSVDEAINQPVYDKQEDIYKDLLNELKEAAAQLSDDGALQSFGDADILFSGNIDKWKRFANSLRLRLAMRVRYANEELAQQHISEVTGSPLIDDNMLNAALATIDDVNIDNRNPLYNDLINSEEYPVWVGFTVTQELLKRSDPRLPVYADLPLIPSAGYRGRPMTLQGDQKLKYGFDSTARLPMFFREAVHTIIVMNAAEVYFLRAEAALAGLSGEDAVQMYRNGITQSLEQYGISTGAVNTYLASPAAGIGTGTDEEKLENIIVQKYLAMYHQGTEAWAEFRRTGYPKIWTGADLGSTNGNIPRRLTYPSSEYARNNANVAAAVSRLNGGDKMMSRMWWDAKPGLPFLHPKQGQFPPEMY
ncbi:MAG: SusD/RagB family nutrient-binding outer membrane lipoprotein [Sphingobacteriales bacterium]|nr:SusD/RagB family nutrient-binding outer membrane lipoprotein [Sphingobacteriales bacterium]